MKNRIYFQFLMLLLVSSLKVHAGTNAFPFQSPGGGYGARLPFDVTVVETDDAKELGVITNKAAALLVANDYDKLDELFAALRSSKAKWANGTWKLLSAYSGLVLSDEASEADWKIRLRAILDWAAARPKSINARVALAYFLVDYAWKARGGGWADTVTDEGWRLFAHRLNQAEAALGATNEFGAQCPVSWSILLKSGLGRNIERADFDAIFDKSIHFAPDYDGYYFRRATYLLPRWHGDVGEWESDLTKTADRIGGDKGDEVYARVVWCMRGVFTNIFNENKLSWTRVDKGFEIIEKDFPDSLAAKSARAHLAVLARDPEKARKYFVQTEGKVDLSEWSSTLQYARFATWAYSH
jgi:Domain of unknown function (DUF4034)